MARRNFINVLSRAAVVAMLTTVIAPAVSAAERDVYDLNSKSIVYKYSDYSKNIKLQREIAAKMAMGPSKYGYELNDQVYKMTDVNKQYLTNDKDVSKTFEAVKSNETAAFAATNVEEGLKVESVSAINAKEVKVTFSQAVKESTVITSKKLNSTNIEFKSLEDPAKNIVGANAAAKLSEDGKTLTITADGTEVFEGRYKVVIKDVENAKSEKIEKYDEVVDLGKDTVAPAIKSIEKVNAATTKVTFTEAIANLASGTGLTYSYKLADGKTVPATDVDVTPAADGKSIELEVQDVAKYAGKTITVTMLGAKDHADNLIKPNPSTFNLEVGEKDGVAPTVASVKALSDTQIEVVFSEEVQGFNDTNKTDFTLTGDSSKIATVTASKIEQDKTDKKKYIVTLSTSALVSGVDSAVADLKIVKTNITDLSGEKMEEDYTAIVTVKKDTVAPKLVSTKIVEDATGQYLVINFDKKLDATATDAVAPVAGTAKSYKDYVTVSGKDITLGASLALTDDNDGVKAKLSEVQFGSAALVDGTKYTFDVKAKGANGETSDAIEIEFAYEEKASTDKPELDSTNTFKGQAELAIVFDKELDGASATNVANYKIDGVEVKKAVLAPVNAGKQTVTLTLGKNELSGNRAITISGVKAKDGAEMDKFEGTVELKENVKPTVTAAKVTSTTTIELTFSEDVTLTGTTNFDVFLGDKTVAETGVSTVAETANKTVITLTTALTEDDLAKAITVKPASGIDVKDSAGNILDFEEIAVTK